MPYLTVWKDQVQQCQPQVPGEDEQILKESVDRRQEKHGSSGQDKRKETKAFTKRYTI